MRYAVFADVHGNLHALRAALDELAELGIDAYLCAGDLVGYGPMPNECVTLVRGLGAVVVAGNHDLIATGRLPDDGCSPLARDSLRWTRARLQPDVRRYLAELPHLATAGEGVVVAHGSLQDPWEYVREPAQRAEQLAGLARDHAGARVLVLGHTHRAAAHSARRGELRASPGARVELEDGDRLLVNPGSIGQSRDGRPRARFAVLDTDARRLSFHEVRYDVRGCRRALRREGLPSHSHHPRPAGWRRAAARARRVARATLAREPEFRPKPLGDVAAKVRRSPSDELPDRPVPAAAMTAPRTAERIRAHYEVEVELADRLRRAPRDERRALYGRVYDELFARVSDHPQLRRRTDADAQRAYAERQASLVRRFLPPGGTYVEIGAGDCATARLMAATAGAVVAVEVSREIVPPDLPPNVEVAISDGVSVPVAPGRADVVYSNQLMEHLHPEDAEEQLRNIAAALRPGGHYVCVTPNRLTGPHDVSQGFDRQARGFHLREYTYGELRVLLRRAGFRRVRVLERARGRALTRLVQIIARVHAPAARALERAGDRPLLLPLAPYLLVEQVAARWPGGPGRHRVFRRLLDIHVAAER